MSADEEETFAVEAEAIRASARALLVQLETGEELWVPRSVIHDDSEVYEAGHAGTLVVQAWWALKKGIA